MDEVDILEAVVRRQQNRYFGKYRGLVVGAPGSATWIEDSTRFWYRRAVKGGDEFVLVDAETQAKEPAFDHEKLAATLNDLVEPEEAYTAVTLPFNTPV